MPREKEDLRDWPKLPPELLVSIAEQCHLADVARLPAVCGGWAWALGQAGRGFPPPPPALRATFVPFENSSPWLLLPNSNGNESECCDFLSHSESRPLFRISPLPEMAGRIFVGGSPDGWIVTVDSDLIPRILNPLNGEEFCLPCLAPISDFYMKGLDWSTGFPSKYAPQNFKHSYIKKILLTSAPPHGIAFLIHGPARQYISLAMARVGDQTWIPAISSIYFQTDYIEDIAFNKKDGKLYVINFYGKLVLLDLKNHQWPRKFQSPEKIVTARGDLRVHLFVRQKMYIFFTSTGDLLLVRKIYNDGLEEPNIYEKNDFKATSFELFKFHFGCCDDKNSESCWVQVKDLGDNAIFLGLGPSTCITTSDKPWLRRNSVYFVDKSLTPGDSFPSHCSCDEGIYHLKDDKIERFFSDNSKVNLIPPIWYMPSRLRLFCDSSSTA